MHPGTYAQPLQGAKDLVCFQELNSSSRCLPAPRCSGRLRKDHLNTRASSFEDHLSQLEHASLERVSQQRQVYDAKLREQEKENQVGWAVLKRTNTVTL